MGENRKIKILAIGNSFSEDATYYLHQIAQAAGQDTKVVNLYIGGCSLERHWNNIQNDAAEYEYQLDGVKTGKLVSIDEILKEECWDYIVTQQASPDSGWPDTYEPFLGWLSDYCKEKVPTAEFLLQQTWAYEPDSPHTAFPRYHRNQQEMYRRSREAYLAASRRHQLRLIPCGDAVQRARELTPFRYSEGGVSLSRDGHHMSFVYGRYLLAAVWAGIILGLSMKENSFVPSSDRAPGEEAKESELAVLKACADSFLPKAAEKR